VTGAPAARDAAPFVRGSPFASTDVVPYPRADPADQHRLPGGTWQASTIPSGVRIEWVGDAEAVTVSYRADPGGPFMRQGGYGLGFDVWVDDQPRGLVAAATVAGEASVTLAVGPGRVRVYLPEGLRPRILSLSPEGGSIEPAPAEPSWVAYGDSIAEGWAVTAPGLSWPARLGRQLGLDECNMGYAGTARGELASAEQLGGLAADVISISYGTNCWSTIPHSTALIGANLEAFLDLVRRGHPDTPLVVATPIVRPDAEATPNRLGATLAALRSAMDDVLSRRVTADPRLVHVPGWELLDAALLVDGVHPGDEGHRVLAERMGKALAPVIGVR
jgi:lysophospholipase L1-like esterase